MRPIRLATLSFFLCITAVSAQQQPSGAAAATQAASVPAVPKTPTVSVSAAPSVSTPLPLRPVPGKPGLRLESDVAKPSRSKKRIAYDYEGIFVRASRMEEPKQLISPKAPASLGNGEAHLARNPHTGRAEGIRLFGIRF